MPAYQAKEKFIQKPHGGQPSDPPCQAKELVKVWFDDEGTRYEFHWDFKWGSCCKAWIVTPNEVVSYPRNQLSWVAFGGTNAAQKIQDWIDGDTSNQSDYVQSFIKYGEWE